MVQQDMKVFKKVNIKSAIFPIVFRYSKENG